MAEYTKPWLPVDEQIDGLSGHGVEIEDRGRAASVLQAVGYYRPTDYHYPFRESETCVDDQGHAQIRILRHYTVGATLRHAENVIDFNQRLRMLDAGQGRRGSVRFRECSAENFSIAKKGSGREGLVH